MNIFDKYSIANIGDFILQSFELAIQQSGSISIALSGGNTPKALFEYWLTKYSEKKLWHSIQYFWVDERCVAPSHAESNYGVAHTLFFEPLHISPLNIHRIQGEENPQKEALRYHSMLSKKVTKHKGIPQFDFILLGIGDDGHTASIFPGNENLFYIPQNVVNTTNPYTKQQRITLTGPIINMAKHVMFIVTGESKRNILQVIADGTQKKYPAQYVNPENGLLSLLTDIKL